MTSTFVNTTNPSSIAAEARVARTAYPCGPATVGRVAAQATPVARTNPAATPIMAPVAVGDTAMPTRPAPTRIVAWMVTRAASSANRSRPWTTPSGGAAAANAPIATAAAIAGTGEDSCSTLLTTGLARHSASVVTAATTSPDRIAGAAGRPVATVRAVVACAASAATLPTMISAGRAPKAPNSSGPRRGAPTTVST